MLVALSSVTACVSDIRALLALMMALSVVNNVEQFLTMQTGTWETFL